MISAVRSAWPTTRGTTGSLLAIAHADADGPHRRNTVQAEFLREMWSTDARAIARRRSILSTRPASPSSALASFNDLPLRSVRPACARGSSPAWPSEERSERDAQGDDEKKQPARAPTSGPDQVGPVWGAPPEPDGGMKSKSVFVARRRTSPREASALTVGQRHEASSASVEQVTPRSAMGTRSNPLSTARKASTTRCSLRVHSGISSRDWPLDRQRPPRPPESRSTSTRLAVSGCRDHESGSTVRGPEQNASTTTQSKWRRTAGE